MSVAGVRNRDSFGTVAGPYRVLAGNTGLITLVPAPLRSTIYVQKIHVQITTPSVGERWTFQDGKGILLVPNVSADAVGHFDFNFGPDGVPCSEASAFVLNITGATGAVGWITWTAFQSLIPAALLAYPALVITDGASNYWRLNETSGVTAFDLIGGKHGTISGGVTLNQPGALADGDRAMTFDGVSGKIVTAAPVPLAPPWTYEAWFYYRGGPYPAIFNTTTTPPNAQDLITIYIGPQDRVSWRHYPAGSSISENGEAPFFALTPGGWHHLVIITTSLIPLIYIDAVAQTLITPPVQPVGAISQTIEFGAITWQALYADGVLDEIALYPYALSASQIRAHFQAASRRTVGI